MTSPFQAREPCQELQTRSLSLEDGEMFCWIMESSIKPGKNIRSFAAAIFKKRLSA